MKQIITVSLAILLIILIPVSAGAKIIYTEGDWSYQATSDSNAWTIDSYNGTASEVTLAATFASKPVIAASDYAFMNHTDLLSVDTGEVLSSIGEYCFIGCSTLKTVKLNNALTSIGIGAFANTTSLSSVNLKDSSIELLSAYSFAGSGIRTISLPESCTEVAPCAFQNCTSLSRVEIPDSVTQIAENTFNGCGQLVIACNYDSYAREYAVANGINYELLDAIEYSYVVGDTGGDGVIGIMDATIIQRMLVGLQDDPTGYLTLRGDAGSDGLSIYDATDIQRYLVGLPIESNVGERVTKVIYLND